MKYYTMARVTKEKEEGYIRGEKVVVRGKKPQYVSVSSGLSVGPWWILWYNIPAQVPQLLKLCPLALFPNLQEFLNMAT